MDRIQKNVLLASYTTFGIGGLAKYFAEAETLEDLREFCDWAKAKSVGIFVLGGGSNVLISDKGFSGLVIKITNSKFRIENSKLYAASGTPLAKLVLESANVGLSGLEWAIGIPGTVGGAICGNSGAFGKETGALVESVGVLDYKNFSLSSFNKNQCDFSYRDSIFKRQANLIILDAVFVLKKEDDKKIIFDKMKDSVKQRTNSLVGNKSVDGRSAGYFFKNIEWKRKDINKSEILKKFPELKQFAEKPKISAGFLIEFLGMKGKIIGEAQVSEKHANFLINLGQAKAEHVMMLSSLIKQRIYNHYGFSLEEEVQLIGFDVNQIQ